MPPIGVKAGQADRPRRRRVTRKAPQPAAQRGFSSVASFAGNLQRHPRQAVKRGPIDRKAAQRQQNTNRAVRRATALTFNEAHSIGAHAIQAGHPKLYNPRTFQRDLIRDVRSGYYSGIHLRSGYTSAKPGGTMRYSGFVSPFESSGSKLLGIPLTGGEPLVPKVKRTDFGLQVIGWAKHSKPVSGVGVTAGATQGQRDIISQGLGHAADLLPGKTAKKIGRNLISDAVNLPAQTVPAVAHVAGTALGGHVAKAAKEVVQPYADLVKHPIRSFENHPLGSAFLLAGPAATLDRGLGRVAGGREAPAGQLEGVGMRAKRQHSRNLSVRTVQKARHKRAVKRVDQGLAKAANLDARARTAHPHDQADMQQAARRIRHEALAKHPDRLKAKEIQRRVDNLEGQAQGISAGHRDQVTRPLRKALRTDQAKAAGHALPILAHSIAKPTRSDLTAYLHELQAQHDAGLLSHGEMRANESLRSELGHALKNKRFDPVAARAIVDKHYLPVVRQLEGKLHEANILPKARAERAALIPFAARKMGATREGGRMVVPSKQIGPALVPMRNDAVAARLRAEGHPAPAFITQAPNMRGAKNFYRHYTNQGSISTRARTGAATRRGTFDAHPETMIEQAARMRSLLDSHENYARFLGQFAHRTNGRIDRLAYDKAQRRAEEISAHTGVEFVPVKATAFHGQQDQAAHLIDLAQTGPHDSGAHADMLRQAIDGKQGTGSYVLVPKEARDRLDAHLRVLGPGSGLKMLRAYTGVWRKTVLALSPKWLTGNVVEAGVRTLLAHKFNPFDIAVSGLVARRAFQTLEKRDPEAALAARVAARPGGHFGMAGSSTPRTGVEQFRNAPAGVRKLVAAVGAFGHAPGPKQLAGLWSAYTRFVFDHVNEGIERPFQTALAGKWIRENLQGGNINKLSATAIEQAARGLKDTNEQFAMAEFVRRAYGQYNAFSPAERQYIALYTPFLAWTKNAVTFLTSVLPRDHPLVTSMLVAANISEHKWLEQHGLDVNQKKGLPSFLQGSIPTKTGHMRFQYTPFALAGDPTGSIANLVLPQFSGVIAAAQGRDWRGRTLTGADGQPLKGPAALGGYAMAQALIGLVPGAALAQRIVEGKGSVGKRFKKELPFQGVASNTRGSSSSKRSTGGLGSGGLGSGGLGSGGLSP